MNFFRRQLKKSPSINLLRRSPSKSHQWRPFSISTTNTDETSSPSRSSAADSTPIKQPPPRSPPPYHNKANDVILSNMMITSYIRSGDLDSALDVFRNMTITTTVTWNSILAGYSKSPGKLRDAQKVFVKIPQPDTVSYNTMLSCYVNSSNMDSALSFFHRIPNKDTASYNTMISGFAQNRRMSEATSLFNAMPEGKKNAITWNAMISGYVECSEMEEAMNLFEMSPVKTVVARTAILTGTMKLGDIETAERMFMEMPQKNLVTWNAMISGYVENGRSEEGMKLFKEMVRNGFSNSSTLSSVLLCCSELSSLQLGKQVHQLVCKSYLISKNQTVSTSLISMYCKCGDLEDGHRLFMEMEVSKDVVAWNAMISGYAQHGEGLTALGLFDRMKESRVKPDWITFVAVLLACNHSGLVDVGWNHFDSMKNDYGVDPRPDHYSCMVDLLSRAGRLDSALELIKNMPFKPHPAIYGTLLGACRVHKNAKVAEFAAKNLVELDPTSSTAYVQLANVYAATKKWEEVARVRRVMKRSNVVKVPGYSWIEVENRVHEFRSGDRVHPELDSIHRKLDQLEKKMKRGGGGGGYVHDLESALHDVGDEQKGEMLMRHSEKLAIAYGLMKLPGNVPIRVFKNLRICEDCHRMAKCVSRVEGREIVVRDTTRFHRFRDGLCSCGDYW